MIIQRLFENRAFLFSSSFRVWIENFIIRLSAVYSVNCYNVVRSLDELDDRLAIHCKNPVNHRDTFFLLSDNRRSTRWDRKSLKFCYFDLFFSDTAFRREFVENRFEETFEYCYRSNLLKILSISRENCLNEERKRFIRVSRSKVIWN